MTCDPRWDFEQRKRPNLHDWPESEDELELVLAGIRDLVHPALPTVVTPGETPQSIAVLPFLNMSSDPEQDYFSDGISEDILNGLVKNTTLKVIARTSSFQFREKNQDVREIGEQLNVSHILEGSVRKSGDRIRVTVQLNSTDDGTHVWSDPV